jgi:hypothetical protein
MLTVHAQNAEVDNSDQAPAMINGIGSLAHRSPHTRTALPCSSASESGGVLLN